MSWLARSLATLRLDDDDDDENDIALNSPNPLIDSSTVNRNEEGTTHQSSLNQQRTEIEQNRRFYYDNENEDSHARGVKEDLTELKQTLTRQLWGVASFLAPPPMAEEDRSVSNLNESQPSDRSGSEDELDSAGISGIRPDLWEIGGEMNSFSVGSEENEVIGITEEVLAFARNIAMHPETWLDFPLDEEDDLDDFDMSDAQREHVLGIEKLAPRLAALRIELCPCHMTESYFWKVYFVLLHSRLNKQDAEVLSTSQVMEARAMWMQELHKQTKPDSYWYGRSTSYVKDNSSILQKDFECSETFNFERNTSMTTDYETEKHTIECTEMQYIDKPVIEEKVMKTEVKDPLVGSSSKVLVPDYEDNEDDWLNEEDSDIGSYKATIPMGNEEDISFSDLEDDANGNVPIKSKDTFRG